MTNSAMVAFVGRTLQVQPEILERMLQIKGNSLNCKIDERKGPDVRGRGAGGLGDDGFEAGQGTVAVC